MLLKHACLSIKEKSGSKVSKVGHARAHETIYLLYVIVWGPFELYTETSTALGD